jgi:hypothetical protein
MCRRTDPIGQERSLDVRRQVERLWSFSSVEQCTIPGKRKAWILAGFKVELARCWRLHTVLLVSHFQIDGPGARNFVFLYARIAPNWQITDSLVVPSFTFRWSSFSEAVGIPNVRVGDRLFRLPSIVEQPTGVTDRQHTKLRSAS